MPSRTSRAARCGPIVSGRRRGGRHRLRRGALAARLGGPLRAPLADRHPGRDVGVDVDEVVRDRLGRPSRGLESEEAPQLGAQPEEVLAAGACSRRGVRRGRRSCRRVGSARSSTSRARRSRRHAGLHAGPHGTGRAPCGGAGPRRRAVAARRRRARSPAAGHHRDAPTGAIVGARRRRRVRQRADDVGRADAAVDVETDRFDRQSAARACARGSTGRGGSAPRRPTRSRRRARARGDGSRARPRRAASGSVSGQ